MRSTILVLALGCTAFVAALPVNTTDSLTDLSISGPLVPVDTTDPTVSNDPTVSVDPAVSADPTDPADITSLTSPTSPLDGVGEDPLTGSAFLVTNGSAADAPAADEAASGPASFNSTSASIFELPGSPLSSFSISAIPTSTPAFALPGQPLSVVSVFPSPTTTATSIFELPGRPLSAVTFSPIPTSTRPIASIHAIPGSGNLGAFSPNGFKRQVRTSGSWRRVTQKRRIGEESA